MSDHEFENYLTLISRFLRLSPARARQLARNCAIILNRGSRNLSTRANRTTKRCGWPLRNSATPPGWPPNSVTSQ